VKQRAVGESDLESNEVKQLIDSHPIGSGLNPGSQIPLSSLLFSHATILQAPSNLHNFDIKATLYSHVSYLRSIIFTQHLLHLSPSVLLRILAPISSSNLRLEPDNNAVTNLNIGEQERNFEKSATS